MTLSGDFNASVNVPFQRMRQLLLDGPLQEGVVGASDVMVVQRGAGANQSVDVGTGFAWVQLDTGTRNGLPHVTNDAVANVTVTAANGTNPRIDQIILRWNDTSIPTGSGNVPTLEVLTGTATSGATLANRTGAAALPNDCLRLADLLIPALSTTISNTQIRDRRLWARGAYVRIVRTAGNYTTASATMALVDGTNLQPRIECSGNPLRVTLRCNAFHTTASSTYILTPWVDGAAAETGSTDFFTGVSAAVASGPTTPMNMQWTIVPAAGSHLIGWAWRTPSGASATLTASTTQPLEMEIEEIIRQNTANNTTTSG
jgi:hypothetical protein